MRLRGRLRRAALWLIRLLERATCDHDWGSTCSKCQAGKAYSRGHRDARMRIDAMLESPGKGSMGDLEYDIRKLKREAAEAGPLRARVAELEALQAQGRAG